MVERWSNVLRGNKFYKLAQITFGAGGRGSKLVKDSFGGYDLIDELERISFEFHLCSVPCLDKCCRREGCCSYMVTNPETIQ